MANRIGAIFLSYLILTLPVFASLGSENTRPNIIFILTDDQRYDALGCMGNSDIQTPNIDRIGENGIIFRQHYNTTAICMASRASIMTGMYEHKHGCNFMHGALYRDKFENSYPVLLQKSGYITGFAGKFGFAVKDSADYMYHAYEDLPVERFDWWKGWPGQGYYETEKNKYLQEYAEEFPHVSTALGAAAVDFIRKFGNDEKPFCLSVSFKAPHDPARPNPEYDDVYMGKTFPRKKNYWKENGEHLPVQSKQGRQFKRLSNYWMPEKYDRSLAKYYQLIYGVDQAVGMLLDELEAQNLVQNTIIIFTSDNGYHCGAHGFGGKVLTYEEGARAPLLIYAPGAKVKGSISEVLTGNIDIAPTILDLAGIPIPENMDGNSLVPVLSDPSTEVKDSQMLIQVWGEDPTHSLGIVSNGFKYLFWSHGGIGEPAEELYDLEMDPYEMRNLVEDETFVEKLQKLRVLYDDYVEGWGKEACKHGNYKPYSTVFNRKIPWKDKKKYLDYNNQDIDEIRRRVSKK